MMIRCTVFLLLGIKIAVITSTGTSLSTETNGVYLAIAGWPPEPELKGTNTPIRFDSPLIFIPFCDTGRVDLAYPLEPAYAATMTMRGPSGSEARKTSVGRRFGSKFERLHDITDTRAYPISAWGSYQDNPGLGGARFFFNYPAEGAQSKLTPKDLFEMKDPGTYVLEVQMQMFHFSPQSTNKWKQDLLRFPPVRIKVDRARGDGTR